MAAKQEYTFGLGQQSTMHVFHKIKTRKRMQNSSRLQQYFTDSLILIHPEESGDVFQVNCKKILLTYRNIY